MTMCDDYLKQLQNESRQWKADHQGWVIEEGCPSDWPEEKWRRLEIHRLQSTGFPTKSSCDSDFGHFCGQ